MDRGDSGGVDSRGITSFWQQVGVLSGLNPKPKHNGVNHGNNDLCFEGQAMKHAPGDATSPQTSTRHTKVPIRPYSAISPDKAPSKPVKEDTQRMTGQGRKHSTSIPPAQRGAATSNDQEQRQG